MCEKSGGELWLYKKKEGEKNIKMGQIQVIDKNSVNIMKVNNF